LAHLLRDELGVRAGIPHRKAEFLAETRLARPLHQAGACPFSQEQQDE